MSDINNFFNAYLTKNSLFKDKAVLLSTYIPEEILYRDEFLKEVANVLAPALRMEKPSNLFIYGKTGTGKTLSVRHVLNSLETVAKAQNIPLKAIYINCKMKRVSDTEYRLISQLIKEFGDEVPPTGLPTDEIYSIFYRHLDRERRTVILVLDEVDQLTKKIGDDVLYNLTRINSELKRSQIVLVGISNNLVFSEHLDPRVKSSLSEEELIFPPYNALQIQEILSQRSKLAFQPDVLLPGVIEKCSAFSARDHGDVRRALDLLRVAGEIAERNGSAKVDIIHLDEAEKKVESDKIITATMGQPKQFHSVLYSILLFFPQKQRLFTGEIYEVYKKICQQSRQNTLTQRRISDILGEMDLLGIINAQIISKGRYGRTREISLSLEENAAVKLKEMLEKSLQI